MTFQTSIVNDDCLRLRKRLSVECTACCAKKLTPCSGANGLLDNTLQESSLRKTYTAGQPIFHAGDNPSVLVTIISGIVATSATLEDGRTQILSLHFRGDVLGRIDGAAFSHEIIAMTNVRLCHKKRGEFMKSINQDSGFRSKFIEQTASNLEESRSWMLTLGRKNSLERVATFLVVLAMRGGPQRKDPPEDNLKMTIPLSREEIANHLGLTIATISRAFTKLRKTSIIKVTAKEVTIPCFNDLVAATGNNGSGFVSQI